MEKWIIQWIRQFLSNTILIRRTYFFLQDIDGPAEFVKLFDIVFNFINTIDDRGMVSLPQSVSDRVERHVGHIAAQIHYDLPGLDDLGISL